MAETLCRLIPTDLSAEITKERAESAVEYLKEQFGTNDVVYVIAHTPMFVECGDMLHYVGCPHCQKQLPFRWWAEEMARCAETGFTKRSVTFPCCKKSGLLEDIEYREPCGLAKIVFEAREPAFPLDSESLNTLRLILGCDLRVIQAHYS